MGFLVALKRNAGRALVMPAAQQPAEQNSTATVNGLVLPHCSVTRAQGHSQVLSPPLRGHHEATLLLAGMLTADQPHCRAVECLRGTANLWGCWAALPAGATAPLSPPSASLPTRVGSVCLSKCSWRYHTMDDSLGLSFFITPH